MECFRRKDIFSRISKLDLDLRRRCIPHGSFCSLASLLSPNSVSIARSERYHTTIPQYRMEAILTCIGISHILPISIIYHFSVILPIFPSFFMIAWMPLSKCRFIHCNLCCERAQLNEWHEYAVILRFLIFFLSVLSHNQ